MRVLIFGPQGVGKGTQSVLLAAHWGVPHISTGDLFRANIEGGTHVGRQAKAALERGELVPDSLTQAMLAERLNHDDAREGFLLDGFPRNLEQADWLDAMIEGTNGIDAVILLRAPTDVLIERALQRGRSDDTVELIRKRLDIYHLHTEALLRFYAGRVDSIDGNRSVQLVFQEIVARVSDLALSY